MVRRKLLVCIVVFTSTFFSFALLGFVTFRRVLDAEMQEATRMGVTLKTKGDEKEAVNNEEEELFSWWHVFVNGLK